MSREGLEDIVKHHPRHALNYEEYVLCGKCDVKMEPKLKMKSATMSTKHGLDSSFRMKYTCPKCGHSINLVKETRK